jgi:hypothetical protein
LSLDDCQGQSLKVRRKNQEVHCYAHQSWNVAAESGEGNAVFETHLPYALLDCRSERAVADEKSVCARLDGGKFSDDLDEKVVVLDRNESADVAYDQGVLRNSELCASSRPIVTAAEGLQIEATIGDRGARVRPPVLTKQR